MRFKTSVDLRTFPFLYARKMAYLCGFADIAVDKKAIVWDKKAIV